MKILVIDDDADVKKQFDQAIELWNRKQQNNPNVEIFTMDFLCELQEAKTKFQEDLCCYDGIVVDLRFKDQIEGDGLIEILNSRLIRIPVVVYTGTPDPVDSVYIKLCKKSEQKADDILKWLNDVKMSGVLAVMGMRGNIEKHLKDIFDRFQCNNLDRWARLGRDKGIETAQSSASRYVLMHLLDTLYCETENVFPDEFYLRVEKTDPLRTGDIVFCNDNNQKGYYLIMSPACDLVIYNGLPKTESVLLAKLVSTKEATCRTLNDKISKWKSNGYTDEQLAGNIKKFLNDFRANKSIPEYVHAIPSIREIKEKYISFRRVINCPYENVNIRFKRTGLRISPPFLKDIQARFASYYGRQGQPNIDFSLEYSANDYSEV